MTLMPYDQDPTPQPHEYRIYGDDNAQTWVVVDQVDYLWAVQWRWHFNKPHPGRNGSKQYLVRSNGSGGRRRGKKFILHLEIMKRKGISPPTDDHIYVAHLDDDEFNCRRANLDWTTPKNNRSTSEKAKSNWSNLHKRQKAAANARKFRKDL